jgi:hypothetical protein
LILLGFLCSPLGFDVHDDEHVVDELGVLIVVPPRRRKVSPLHPLKDDVEPQTLMEMALDGPISKESFCLRL